MALDPLEIVRRFEKLLDVQPTLADETWYLLTDYPEASLEAEALAELAARIAGYRGADALDWWLDRLKEYLREERSTNLSPISGVDAVGPLTPEAIRRLRGAAWPNVSNLTDNELLKGRERHTEGFRISNFGKVSATLLLRILSRVESADALRRPDGFPATEVRWKGTPRTPPIVTMAGQAPPPGSLPGWDDAPTDSYGVLQLGRPSRASRPPAEVASPAKAHVKARRQTQLGSNLLRLMGECGWSYDILSARTGIDKKAILRHVNHGARPRPGTLKLYAQAFTKELGNKITVADLKETPRP